MKLRIVVPRNRTRRVVSSILLLIGVVCLGIYSYSYLYRTAYQLYEGWQFDHESEQQATPDPQPLALPVVLPDPDRAAPRTATMPEGVIGRISIPRLHLSAMVEE